ncbi:MAG: eCIS core domain-containing protein [Thainema sp.]
MKKRQYARKPAPDTSVRSAENLLQTRPFQAIINNSQQTLQVQNKSNALIGGFDLTKKQLFPNSQTIPTLGQPLQAKLTIGQPNDKYEQEADRVAQSVVQHIHSSKAAAKSSPTLAQRQDESLQMKPILQKQEGLEGNEASSSLEASINQARNSGQPLDTKLQRQMGQAMGADFSGVKVHTDSRADQLNCSIQAKAFTTGQDMFFRQGAYQPGSRGGQELIAHELTHVIQQNGSAATPAMIQAKVGDPVDNLQSLTRSRFNEMATRQSPGYAEASQRLAQEFYDYLESQAQQSNDQDISQGFFQLLHRNTIDITSINSLLETVSAELNQSDQGVKVKFSNFYAGRRSAFEQAKGLGYIDRVHEYYLKERENIALPQAYLTNDVKQQFATALQQMPTIQYLIHPDQNQNMFVAHDVEDDDLVQGQQRESQWKNGGSILDNIQILTKTTRFLIGTASRQDLEANGVKRNALEGRLRAAETFIKRLIEPQILEQLNPPQIQVTTRKSIKADNTVGMGIKLLAGYERPEQGSGIVTIGYNEKPNLIAHEVGHYVEENISSDLWHENQLLLRSRHAASGGGNRVGHNLLKGKKGGVPTESRYRGKYDATGQYTSRYYGQAGEGATEITSLSFEFLSEPNKALQLITRDPLQAAIVLRQVRPQEYQNTNGLRQFDQYLPH